jgi:hypothetical protein
MGIMPVLAYDTISGADVMGATNMTEWNAPAPLIANATTQDYDNYRFAYEMFNGLYGNTSDHWGNATIGDGEYAWIDLGGNNNVTQFFMQQANANTIRNFTIYGSTTTPGTSGTVLFDSSSKLIDISNYANISWNLTKANFFRYYTFYINKSTSGTAFRVSELRFFNDSYSPPIGDVIVTLNKPSNNTILNSIGEYFNVTYNVSTTRNITNATYYLWNSTGIFNRTSVTINGTSNFTSHFIDALSIGSYEWNSLMCMDNGTCLFAPTNFTFTVGATINWYNFTENVYETQLDTFFISIKLFEGSELSLAQLIYNNTIYPISNITYVGGSDNQSLILTKTIDIPLIANPFASEVRSFYWKFVYTGTTQQNQTIPAYTQNVSFINLALCNSTWTLKALNFTLYDEVNETVINAATTAITFRSSWNYWLGSGEVIKNFSYQTLYNTTANSYAFCIFPDVTINTNSNIDYQVTSYAPNAYTLANSELTSTGVDIKLYSVLSALATKFYVNIRQGVSYISDAVVTIARDNLGTFVTDGIATTDINGQFPFYALIDNKYRFSVVKNGVLLGIVDKTMSCASAPCSVDINLATEGSNPFYGYEQYFSNNTLSSLYYNPTTSMVTYTFLDITGLAHYFRLVVNKVSFNETTDTICDTYAYTAAGTLTCNMTGLDGDYIAKGYLSRSPETEDKSLGIFLSNTGLGLFAIFISFALIVTMVIGAATISRGNPATVIFVLGLSILLLKIMTIFPFSWIVVAVLEALIFFILIKIGT